MVDGVVSLNENVVHLDYQIRESAHEALSDFANSAPPYPRSPTMDAEGATRRVERGKAGGFSATPRRGIAPCKITQLRCFGLHRILRVKVLVCGAAGQNATATRVEQL